ncbi:alpha/beta hydrolase [Auraticoccus monumenti]|uniref:Lysophospholipase, alpha-beta hydrolase superfamily n=1 Tax=Auraticoccus monumenti TaxID=675864 RepID=A0A1G6WB59_9ACTN|nr:alpha/beta hydrolase [Auraticoccus monumenti]SDD62286.1 Lysophospholipase, alpha-beta hydrolase superfamily [Auraticoccus monumenti]
MTTASWRADVLPGYEARDLPLPDALPAPGEPEDAGLVATLVRRVADRDTDRAVLYVHGWNDYFFQTHLADALAELGFAFYAVDLRRYGRSYRPGQLQGWINDLDLYAEELDAAMEVVTADHPHVTLMAHSTGGLIGAMWADRRPGRLDGMVLNSPWLDLQGAPMLRALGTPIISGLGQRLPTAALPLPDSGNYARILHASLEGEWDYDLQWKASPTAPIRAGWLRAVLQGHQRVAAGLSVDAPVLVMCASRSDFRRAWHPELRQADTVLDVEQIAKRAVQLGPHVSVVRIEGGIHDLVLSDEPARSTVFRELTRWARAYLLPSPVPAPAPDLPDAAPPTPAR